LIDEVYVKPMLTYHGGELFGSSVNDNSQFAKTVFYDSLFVRWTQVFGQHIIKQIKDDGNLVAIVIIANNM